MNKISSAEILCVGTELLLGQIVNTNAAFLANELNLIGINSYFQTVVGDNPSRLVQALKIAADRSDLIILTGGLGPTRDDLTMATTAQFAGRSLVLHEPSKQAIEGYFTAMHRNRVTQNNWKQAMMPTGSIVLPNYNGTAPGAIIENIENGAMAKTIVLLPGPPSELRPMFNESVKPYLLERSSQKLRHLFVRLIGIGESAAETRLMDLIDQQENPTLAPYASEGEVMFRITQRVERDDEPDLTQDLLKEVYNRVGEYIYEVGPRKLPEVIKDLLIEQNRTLSLAESCTGGLIASALTDVPGISTVFKGGIVAYDNDIKKQMLSVDERILLQDGAVSENCVKAMATGCRDVMKTDYAIAVTGIAGPTGGTDEKPVGTVWIAVAGPNRCEAKMIFRKGNRARIRRVAMLYALDMLRRELV